MISEKSHFKVFDAGNYILSFEVKIFNIFKVSTLECYDKDGIFEEILIWT